MNCDKDIMEKHLESFNDVFADIINVLIYGGREVINEKEKYISEGEIKTTGKLIKNLIEKTQMSVDEAFSMPGVRRKCR